MDKKGHKSSKKQREEPCGTIVDGVRLFLIASTIATLAVILLALAALAVFGPSLARLVWGWMGHP